MFTSRNASLESSRHCLHLKEVQVALRYVNLARLKLKEVFQWSRKDYRRVTLNINFEVTFS